MPGRLDAPTITALVAAFSPGKLSVLGMPGTPAPGELTVLGVARVSYGPYPQQLALHALAGHAAALLSGHDSAHNQT